MRIEKNISSLAVESPNNPAAMKYTYRKLSIYCSFLVISIFTISCSENKVVPAELSGTYTGKERVIIRYNNGGQYIFRQDSVLVSLMIDSGGLVTGMIGEAAFEGCKVVQNRGWLGRQLNIKTEYIIRGILTGYTFPKDTIVNKRISIPFNIENGILKGSIFMAMPGEDYPLISILRIKKR